LGHGGKSRPICPKNFPLQEAAKKEFTLLGTKQNIFNQKRGLSLMEVDFNPCRRNGFKVKVWILAVRGTMFTDLPQWKTNIFVPLL
jgi:hypothetical protein